jgi:hypothetical protein
MNPWIRLLVIALVAFNVLLFGWRMVTSGGGEPPAAEPVTATPAAPDLTGVPPIVLLSEMTAPPSSEGPPRWCFAVGPFETLASRERARAALLDIAGAIRERESEALIELGYWVALPPFPDFASAGEAMRGLNRAGLRDTAILSDENGEYRVSLGYFLDEANARRRRDHARSLGYTAETRLQRESQPRYWLDYERDTAPPSSAPEGIPTTQHRPIACPNPEPAAT